jgi:hypothetical protein
VPQGTVVLSGAPNPSDAASGSRFFVLREKVALTNADATDPQPAKTAGELEVKLTFTKQGAAAFQKLTSTIAHRGQLVSVPPTTCSSTSVIGLDNSLIRVPQVDFTKYPDGVVANPRDSEHRHFDRQRTAGKAARGHPAGGGVAARTDPNRPRRLTEPGPIASLMSPRESRMPGSLQVLG